MPSLTHVGLCGEKDLRGSMNSIDLFGFQILLFFFFFLFFLVLSRIDLINQFFLFLFLFFYQIYATTSFVVPPSGNTSDEAVFLSGASFKLLDAVPIRLWK